jgi:hypothetical protein
MNVKIHNLGLNCGSENRMGNMYFETLWKKNFLLQKQHCFPITKYCKGLKAILTEWCRCWQSVFYLTTPFIFLFSERFVHLLRLVFAAQWEN